MIGIVVGYFCLMVASFILVLWTFDLRKARDLIKKDREQLNKEEKKLRQTYIDSIKDVYDLIELLLKLKDQYQFDPEIKKSFYKLGQLQTTLYETLVKLEICELGLEMEVLHEDGPRSKNIQRTV